MYIYIPESRLYLRPWIDEMEAKLRAKPSQSPEDAGMVKIKKTIKDDKVVKSVHLGLNQLYLRQRHVCASLYPRDHALCAWPTSLCKHPFFR